MGQLRGRILHWAVTGMSPLVFMAVSVHLFVITNPTPAASCQAFLLLGYDQGVMSGLIGADNEFGKQFGHPNANMQGISSSILCSIFFAY